MKLVDLTQNGIQQFAGKTIYARGHDYFLSGNVSELSYDPDSQSISAEVAGNYGDYEVDIEQVDGEIRASCNCPYDGYPCKHIVAVLLSFINHRRAYSEKAEEDKSQKARIEERIRKLSREELVAMVMTCASKYPDFHRELMVRFEPDQKQTLETLLKQVSRAFPSIESSSYSTDKIARELNRILQSVENAKEEIRLEVHWAAADSILRELNEYGMDDDALEDVLLSALEAIKNILAEKEGLAPRRREIIDNLMHYFNWGNCGMGDAIYDTVMDLCLEKKDFQAVIEKLESRSGGSSYIRDLLASLYRSIGDEDAELAVLERELQYGMDYWRLAEYWLRKGDREKAMKVVEEGIEKGEGRKQELYDFLLQDYERRADYEGLANLLEEKAQRNDLSRGGIGNDPIYLSLKSHYESQGDYKSREKLLDMRLKRKEIDLSLYREAEETLEKRDWTAFELELIARLEEEQKHETSNWSPGASRALETLAEIYAYKEDLSRLFKTVKGNHALLGEYEDRLLPLHPSHYLEEYRGRAERLIAGRGRGNYRQAVEYLKKVRMIYFDVQKRPEEWDRYIQKVSESNRSLRALQEELRSARLIA